MFTLSNIIKDQNDRVDLIWLRGPLTSAWAAAAELISVLMCPWWVKVYKGFLSASSHFRLIKR